MIIFFCGDVMLGRGIDQILTHKSDPHLYESYLTTAQQYVPIAMKSYTTENKSVPNTYVWGKLLEEKLFLEGSNR